MKCTRCDECAHETPAPFLTHAFTGVHETSLATKYLTPANLQTVSNVADTLYAADFITRRSQYGNTGPD